MHAPKYSQGKVVTANYNARPGCVIPMALHKVYFKMTQLSQKRKLLPALWQNEQCYRWKRVMHICIRLCYWICLSG